MNKVDIIRKHIGKDNFYDMNGTSMMTNILNEMEEYKEQESKAENLPISDVSKRLEMRKQASNVFELTKGFTTETTDNAMKTALEMAHNVMVLTVDLDGPLNVC